MQSPVPSENQMLEDLQQSYQQRIDFLQNKIDEQEKEIESLKTMIALFEKQKDYDC
jgi:uncharacterized coiled-coil protein SlyX